VNRAGRKNTIRIILILVMMLVPIHKTLSNSSFTQISSEMVSINHEISSYYDVSIDNSRDINLQLYQSYLNDANYDDTCASVFIYSIELNTLFAQNESCISFSPHKKNKNCVNRYHSLAGLFDQGRSID